MCSTTDNPARSPSHTYLGREAPNSRCASVAVWVNPAACAGWITLGFHRDLNEAVMGATLEMLKLIGSFTGRPTKPYHWRAWR